jgi:hypothetical protein
MNRSTLLAAAGMIALAAKFTGAAEANALSEDLRSHPDFDLYSAAIAEGSIESLQKFLIERPASPFSGAVFAQVTQRVECDSTDPNALLTDPNCSGPVATIY